MTTYEIPASAIFAVCNWCVAEGLIGDFLRPTSYSDEQTCKESARDRSAQLGREGWNMTQAHDGVYVGTRGAEKIIVTACPKFN